jgi:hypothetical protein
MRVAMYANTKSWFCSLWRMNTLPNTDICPLYKLKSNQATISFPLQQLLHLVNLILDFTICPAMMKYYHHLEMWLK